MIDRHTIKWLTLKRRWMSIANGDAWPSQSRVPGIFRRDTGDWSGASFAQTTKWVSDGYDMPGFASNQPVNLQPSKRKRPVWSEDEGQIDRTRLLCGDERYRLTREHRDKPRAAKIEIGYGFRRHAPAAVIGQYGLWCIGLIRKLEAEGLDVQVDIISRATSYIQPRRGQCELHIRVQEENQRSDFRSWSAIFAPSGHRHLMFCARAIHADETGSLVNTGFGGSLHGGWSVTSDGDTIKIDCDSEGQRNPTETLTRLARQAGIL